MYHSDRLSQLIVEALVEDVIAVYGVEMIGQRAALYTLVNVQNWKQLNHSRSSIYELESVKKSGRRRIVQFWLRFHIIENLLPSLNFPSLP